MNIKKIGCLNLVLLFLMLYMNGYGQVPFNALFLNKQAIKDNHIEEIKDFTPLEDGATVTDSVYRLYIFNKGLIITEAHIYNTLEESVEQEIRNGCQYSYTGSSSNKLSEKEGDPDAGFGAHQSTFESYKYLNGKMTLAIGGIHYWTMQISGTNFSSLTKYFYYPDRKLKYEVEFEIDVNKEEVPDSKELVSNSRLINFMRLPESVKRPALLTYLGAHENRRTYFLYNKNALIGLYPVKAESAITADKSDTIYSKEKVQELKKIGLDKFSDKYFKGDVYKKIIDDCYFPIKNKELLVNGKPIKEFLSQIGKSDKKYIVFEIAENYFLFYKVIN